MLDVMRAIRRSGQVAIEECGAIRDGDDPHALALRLGAPALFDPGAEPGGAGSARIPLVPRGTLTSRERATRLDWGESSSWTGRGLDALREVLAAVRTPEPDASGPSAGGLIALLAFDLAHEIEKLPRTTEDRDGLPWLVAVACPATLEVDLRSGACRLAWVEDGGGDGAAWGLTREESAELRHRVLRTLEAPRGAGPSGRPAGPLVRLTSRDEHVRRVEVLLEEIRAGEIYQANLSQRLEVAWDGSLLPLHGVLRASNPSPHAGWLRAPGFELVSGSPERLVSLRGRELVSEPIKGTRALPLGPRTPEVAVAALRDELLASEKDRAEHVMIVDLHRNDVGRASAPGTLRVEAMMRVDRRSHVLQAVADVRGTLREGADAVDVMEAMFPGGSVTGIPKIRCLEILDRVERVGRGPYTGSFGWLSAGGDLDLNVLIRSAWRTPRGAAFAAGGGIVADSDPAAEHAESEAKAAALVEAVSSLRLGAISSLRLGAVPSLRTR